VGNDKNLHPQKGVAGCFDRLFTWFQIMFQALDQLAACWLRGWLFVWADREEPDPDETISSWVGRNAAAGHRPALIAEAMIDFFLGAGHCRLAIGK
jgi:hypothetical protein